MLRFTQVYYCLPCRLTHLSFSETHPGLCHLLAVCSFLFSLFFLFLPFPLSKACLASMITIEVFCFHENVVRIATYIDYCFQTCIIIYFVILYFLYTPVYFIYVDKPSHQRSCKLVESRTMFNISLVSFSVQTGGVAWYVFCK